MNCFANKYLPRHPDPIRRASPVGQLIDGPSCGQLIGGPPCDENPRFHRVYGQRRCSANTHKLKYLCLQHCTHRRGLVAGMRSSPPQVQPPPALQSASIYYANQPHADPITRPTPVMNLLFTDIRYAA
ncbi:hypothetical protein J6590_038867 [Homalodisca vitripennis]|nr:hypothetical protein J6590_038867 [Homalodisca vitripennis]